MVNTYSTYSKRPWNVESGRRVEDPVYSTQQYGNRYPQSGSNLTLDSVIRVTTSFALGLILPKKNIDVKTLKITQNSYQTHSPEPR